MGTRRYGVWAGNEQGYAEDTTKCVESVMSGFHSHQCSRKRGHGPDGLYCKQHATQAEANAGTSQTYPMYCVSGTEITEAQAVAHTDKTVTIINRQGITRRENRSTRWHEYFETKGEALQHALDTARSDVRYAKQNLKIAEEALDRLERCHD